MQYFGVPRCPYCKKRVNLIRTWSLKRQGEYQCPRCGGISNIFLSPLVYVLALLAVFSGGAVYFFHKFVLNDVTVSTCLHVLAPFAGFFLISLFLVYLEKPVIKRVSREESGKQGKGRAPAGATGQVYVDEGAYLPKGQAAGSLPPVQSPPPQRVSASVQPTAVIPQAGAEASQRTGVQRRPAVSQSSAGAPLRTGTPSPAVQRRQAAQRTAEQSAAVPRPRPQRPAAQASPSWTAVQQPAPQREAPRVEPPRQVRPSSDPSLAEPRRASHVVSSVEIPALTEDFFKKYDDPAYVERRLKELQQGKNED